MTATRERDCPGVIARPPRIYLGFLAAGVGLNYLWPVSALRGGVPDVARYALGGVLIAVGVVVMAVAVRQFRGACTNVETYKPTTALVADGLFRFSRNPMYLSLTLIHSGIGVAADNLWILGMLLPVLAIIRWNVIAREERYLTEKFGEQYRGYRASVPRWL